MKIIVDAFGGDHAPVEVVKGAMLAVKEFGVDIILTGKTEEILRVFEDLGEKELPKGIEITNATEVIEMCDDPSSAVRVKKDSSMAVGLCMLAENAGDAFVSAGSTGALLSGATLIAKRIHGIRRAAMAPILPNKTGRMVLIDCGANVECTPEYLLQFGFMGSCYAQKVLNVSKPRVGLLNNGTEESKGTPLQKEAYKLLKQADNDGKLCFVGNVEASGIMKGECDVVVTDGFTGNVFLKGMEGVGMFLLGEIKDIFMKNILTKLAAALVLKDMKLLKKKMDPNEVGGTAMLGISKPVIKAHGSSDAYSIRSAIAQAIKAVEGNVSGLIAENVEYMKLSAKEAE